MLVRQGSHEMERMYIREPLQNNERACSCKIISCNRLATWLIYQILSGKIQYFWRVKAMNLQPKDALTEREVESGLKYVIWDGLTAEAMTSLTGGAFLVALAVLMGASNFQIAYHEA